MLWSELYDQTTKPSISQINEFVKCGRIQELCTFLESSYTVIPSIEYSKCSMQRGWNIKYKKSGKSLCTIYPMDGYFIALVVIGAKEQMATELILSNCTEYVQNLYQRVPFGCGGKWLMIDVKDDATLSDVKELIRIRVKVAK